MIRHLIGDAPWWQFWRPSSGAIGGALFGTVAAAVVIFVTLLGLRLMGLS